MLSIIRVKVKVHLIDNSDLDACPNVAVAQSFLRLTYWLWQASSICICLTMTKCDGKIILSGKEVVLWKRLLAIGGQT